MVAAIVGHNRGLLLVTAGFHRQLEVDPPGWLVYVNRDGRRFVDETAPYAVMLGAVKDQRGVIFAIFDEASRAQAEPDPAYAEQFAAGLIACNFVNWVLRTWPTRAASLALRRWKSWLKGREYIQKG